jgi:ankyrin repeat protein
MSGHCDVVKCLLSSGADINWCDHNGQSPLFLASMSGHCDVVKCILSSGAKINLSNKQEQSDVDAINNGDYPLSSHQFDFYTRFK